MPPHPFFLIVRVCSGACACVLMCVRAPNARTCPHVRTHAHERRCHSALSFGGVHCVHLQHHNIHNIPPINQPRIYLAHSRSLVIGLARSPAPPVFVQCCFARRANRPATRRNATRSDPMRPRSAAPLSATTAQPSGHAAAGAVAVCTTCTERSAARDASGDAREPHTTWDVSRRRVVVVVVVVDVVAVGVVRRLATLSVQVRIRTNQTRSGCVRAFGMVNELPGIYHVGAHVRMRARGCVYLCDNSRGNRPLDSSVPASAHVKCHSAAAAAATAAVDPGSGCGH